MAADLRKLKYILIILIMAMFTVCAPAKKNPWIEKRQKSSQLNATQLGRNRYFFSGTYQKKLNKNFKRK
jgi:hypothetical protein